MNPGIRNTLAPLVLLIGGCASTHGLQPTGQLPVVGQLGKAGRVVIN